jgi:ribosomal protein L11
MKGKKGQIKVRITVAQLKNYAMKRGVNITGVKRKENIMRRLVGVPGRRVKAPKKAVNKMTIAELKEYAKKKKIDLKGLRLKKNILARVKA